jgi:transcription elongation factor GreA
MVDKIPMTHAGYVALENDLKHRQQVERPRIIQQIAEARSHGDLSENAEYHAAKEQQSHNEGVIAELEDKLARADVIDVSKLSGDTIKFGATVTLIDEDTDQKKVWHLADRRRAGSGRQEGPHLDHLAARARADRQEERRVGRSRRPRRRQGLRGHQGRVEVARSR